MEYYNFTPENNEPAQGQVVTSEYADLYKSTGSKSSQNERREQLLKDVKERRNTSIDNLRGINEIFNNLSEENEEEPMEIACARKKRNKLKYASRIMLSEYLFEKPDDFEQNWIFKLCPIGSRTLVVAHHGRTQVYNKAGILQTEFKSALPGGGFDNVKSKFTILDCIYMHATSCFAVIDILAWNSFSLLNCSSEFRFFFLRSKMAETPELLEKSRCNEHAFVEVIANVADLQTLGESLSDACENLDGVLFYHTEMNYKGGRTPLVGWLKPFMIPEVLEIPVHNSYFLKKPQNYVNLSQHIAYGKLCRKKKNIVKICDVEMLNEEKMNE